MTDRLAELEAKAVALNAEIAALKAGRAVQPPRVPEVEGVRIVPILPEPAGLPNLKELEKLYRTVKALAPWPLDDKHDTDRPFRGFCASYRWLASKGRTEFPNPRFALGFWLDNAKSWLRDRNSMTSDVSATTLILATYAAGDVAYVPANAQLGHTWTLGLAEHSGRPASPDSWKRVLRDGAASVLPPSAPSRRGEVASPVRIYGG